eukprot:scaffold9760_cov106-Isochrysis_galbana.AAC.2
MLQGCAHSCRGAQARGEGRSLERFIPGGKGTPGFPHRRGSLSCGRCGAMACSGLGWARPSAAARVAGWEGAGSAHQE